MMRFKSGFLSSKFQKRFGRRREDAPPAADAAAGGADPAAAGAAPPDPKAAIKMEGWLRIASPDFQKKASLMNLINEKMVEKHIETVSKKIDKELYNDLVHSKGQFRKNSHFPKPGAKPAAGGDAAAAGGDAAAPAADAAAPAADAAAPAADAAAPAADAAAPAADAAAPADAAAGGAAPAGGPPPAIDAFYFRISGHNIYYTETAKDPVVLGAIAMKNVEKVGTSKLVDQKCFKITNSEEQEWDLCVMDSEPDCSKWVCAIKEALGGPPCATAADAAGDAAAGAGEAAAGEEKKEEDKKEEKEIVEQPIYMLPLPSPVCKIDFNYNAHGDDWKLCGCKEPNQSPINLPDVSCTASMKQTPKMDYPVVQKADIQILYEYNMLRLKPSHKAVNLGTVLDIDGTKYQVAEIQFKTPSDHKIKGQSFAMEVQVVHEAISGDFKKSLILSILYKKKAGAKMPFFNHLDILSLPNLATPQADPFLGDTFTVHQFTQLEEFLDTPVPFNYYRYEGTRSSPPCTPHTTWLVTLDPIPLGSTILEMIRDTLKDPTADPADNPGGVPLNFDGNNRECAPDDDRLVQYYDASSGCGSDDDMEALKKFNKMKEDENAAFGHYEKVNKKATKYFFVVGQEPSGVPGALVVAQHEAENSRR